MTPQGIFHVRIKSSGADEIARIVGDEFQLATCGDDGTYQWDSNWYPVSAMEII